MTQIEQLESGVVVVKNSKKPAEQKLLKSKTDTSESAPVFKLTPVNGEFELPITYHMYGVFMQWLLANRHHEIAGFFSIEDGVIKWAVRCSNDQNGGHVTMTEAQITEAVKILDEENEKRMALNEEKGTQYEKLVFNGQFHTHPFFNAFWSGTDEDDQADHVYDMVCFNPEGGETYFMVYNLGHLRLRKWWWNMGTENWPVVFYQEGVVTLGGEKLNVQSHSGSGYRMTGHYYPRTNGAWQDGSWGYYDETGGYYEQWKATQQGYEEDLDDDFVFTIDWVIEAWDEPDTDSLHQAVECLTDREYNDLVFQLKVMERDDVVAGVEAIRAKLIDDYYAELADGRETPEDFGQHQITYIDNETGEVFQVKDSEALARILDDNEEVAEDDPTDGLPY